MPEGSVYRDLSVEMREGLKKIYQQISQTCAAEGRPESPEALFNDASDQLREVVKETESAAMNIMEIIEKQLELAQSTAVMLASLKRKYGADEELDDLRQRNSDLSADLTSALTALSFQDITGQRIKKALDALNILGTSVVDLYISSGLVMEAAEKNPQKDAKTIREDAQKALDDYKQRPVLKGPDSKGVSQAAIDDMLAQLGL